MSREQTQYAYYSNIDWQQGKPTDAYELANGSFIFVNSIVELDAGKLPPFNIDGHYTYVGKYDPDRKVVTTSNKAEAIYSAVQTALLNDRSLPLAIRTGTAHRTAETGKIHLAALPASRLN